MGYQHTPYTIPLLVGAGLHLVMLGYLLVYRSVYERVPGSQTASLLLIASMVWMCTYALELASTGHAAMVFWNKAQYFGSTVLPMLLFVYVLQYTGHERYVTHPTIALLSVVPVVTVLLALTNEVHGLIWEQVYVDATGTYAVLINHHGPAFWGFTAYAYVLVILGLAVLGYRFVRSRGFYRWQTGGLLVGALAPTVGSILYVSGLNPAPHLNLPVLAFVLTATIVGWSVFRHHLFYVTPVARDTIIEEMDAAVFVLNDFDRVVDANDAAQRLVGWDDESPIGESIEDVWPEHADALSADGSRTRTELHTETSSGRRYFDLRVTPLSNSDDRSVGRLVVLRDVTDRKRRERALERKNEQLEEFAGVLSHDIRNPLSVAHAYLELAREEDDAEAFERVEGAHDRIERIVQDMLTLARQGRSASETEPVELASVAREAWGNVATPEAELAIDDSSTVEADETRLLQLFENLFSNSVEHGNSTVTVRVGTCPGGFYVEDDGPGIPEEDRDEVFAYGYSADEDGTGLGLSIVKSIAEAHGWDVVIGESDAGGVRFEIVRR